ncbi:MAG: DUF1080 domain-containing protein [Verrucomicrobiales bacterium]
MLLRPLLIALLLPCSVLAGEVSLFNGKDFTGWTTVDGKAPTVGWVVEDGVLHRPSKGGDLFSDKEYGDFTLIWEWKIGKAGNSGLKYRVQTYPGKGPLGLEYQMLDDVNHPDARNGTKHQSAALYDFFPAAADKKLNPVGEWNTSKLVQKGTHLEHWLNGAKVLELDTASDAFKTALAASKFKNVTGFSANPKGRLMIQDHGDEVWIRKMVITTED